MEQSKLVDLGWANSWRDTPEIVAKCRELEHGKKGVLKSWSDYSRCVYYATCPECGYRYKVDSGD